MRESKHCVSDGFGLQFELVAVLVEVQIFPVAVEGIFLDELGVGADSGDFSLMEQDDFVGAAESRESRGEENHGAVGFDALVGVFDEILGGFVEAGRGFFHDHECGVAEAGTREAQAESLALVEFLAVFADQRFIAERQEADEVVGVAHFGGFHDLRECQ